MQTSITERGAGILRVDLLYPRSPQGNKAGRRAFPRDERKDQVQNLKTILTIGTLFLTGCVPSLHPLFTDSDLVFENRLLGAWSEGDSKDTWTFEKSGTKGYRLTTTDRPLAVGDKRGGKRSGKFDAHLCQLGKYLFLDLYPQDAQTAGTDFYKAHLVPAHSFLKVSMDGDDLHLAPLSHDWAQNRIARKQFEIAHEVLDGGAIVLTASTKELQAFVLQHAEDPETFAEAEPFHRTKGGHI